MNCVWSSAPAFKLHEVQVLQNKSIKAIYKLPRLTPSITLYSSRLLNISQLGNVELALLMHKLVMNIIRNDLNFPLNRDIHHHDTRSRDNLHQPMIHTSQGRSGLVHKGIILYNAIPLEIKSTVNINNFKLKLRQYIFDHYSPIHD